MLACYGILSVSAEVGRLVKKVGFKPAFYSGIKIQQLLWRVNDSLGLWVLGVYRVLCSCGACYIGQLGRTVLARCGKYDRYICLKQLDKSALAKQNIV